MYISVLSNEIEMDVPQSRINTREDQTAFTGDINIESWSFHILCYVMNSNVLYPQGQHIQMKSLQRTHKDICASIIT